mmetsp:Transcript_63159/g.142354  ORF Transcript_63159/g.142354 Transcript_63159/m.142354 type:complete len:184 (+) Transcript_63159:2-553(+)
MGTSRGMGLAQLNSAGALQGVAACFGASDMCLAAAVGRPLAAACIATVLDRCCQRGEVSVKSANQHLTAVETGEETQTTKALEGDVKRVTACLQSTEGRLGNLLGDLANSMPSHVSSALSVQPARMQKVLDELSKASSLLQRQCRREELTAGWSNYFNLYGGSGNNLQKMGRMAIAECMDECA